MRLKTLLIRLMAGTVLCAAAYILYHHYNPDLRADDCNSSSTTEVLNNQSKPLRFGFHPDSFVIEEAKLMPNQFLGDILSSEGIAYKLIDQLARKAEGVFSARQLRSGKNIALVRKDSCSAASYFIYEPDPYRYVLFRMDDSLDVSIVERNVQTEVETAAGIVESSLWNSMQIEGHKHDLIARMEDALAWSVDFHHIHKGDAYKLVYERKMVDGNPLGIGKLLGAWFKTNGKEFYSVYFENEKYRGFYDTEGRPMKKAFLKAPVRYSRISSRYSKSRFHPVLKRYKGHYGTDYAANYGTPIVAVADGTISKASYTKGNGNYVKIRHDKVIETQYLHMQKFAKGISPGTRVRQGQTIGFVGSTGLATGPHVCFRFWKNGKQVDHLRENLPPPEPMPESMLPEYFRVRDGILAKLNSVEEKVIAMNKDERGLSADSGDPTTAP